MFLVTDWLDHHTFCFFSSVGNKRLRIFSYPPYLLQTKLERQKCQPLRDKEAGEEVSSSMKHELYWD